MVENSKPWTDGTVHVAGADLTIIKGGSGKPLLVLHDELGFPGWLRWHEALAQTHTLHIPIHPGFGLLPRVDWISSVRDLASFYSIALRDMALGPIDVIGFSLGGWVAAEMAASCAHQFRRMVLVAPMGIRPGDGEILDLFSLTARAYLNASVHDPESSTEFATLYGGDATPEQFEAWEDARAESSRLAWQPYMHNPSLAPMLKGVSQLPVLLAWGEQDKVVPISSGHIYNRSIAGSELSVFEDCGHRPETEKAGEFIARVETFLA